MPTSILTESTVRTAQLTHADALEAYRATRAILRVDATDGDPVLRRRLEEASAVYEEAMIAASHVRDREIEVKLTAAQAVQMDAAHALAETRRLDPWSDGAEATRMLAATHVVDALLFEQGEGRAYRSGRACSYAWGWQ